jgi:hypothetical protein
MKAKNATKKFSTGLTGFSGLDLQAALPPIPKSFSILSKTLPS